VKTEGFEKDQTENDVFVLGSIHAAAQRISHLPKLGFVADVCAVVFLFLIAVARPRHYNSTIKYGRPSQEGSNSFEFYAMP
jgi:hypothetical protein